MLQEFHREKSETLLRHEASAPPVAQYDANNTHQDITHRVANARHRDMLRVILGESPRQKRFLDQAAGGELDLLGRRREHVGPRIGQVLSMYWTE